MILIDTSAMIEFLNRTGTSADRTVEQLILNNADVALAKISLNEILQGIKDDKEYLLVKESLIAFPCLSIGETESYAAAAELYRSCRKRGLTIRSTIDLIIAQTAIEHNAQLLHNDRDFDAISSIHGLKIYPLLP